MKPFCFLALLFLSVAAQASWKNVTLRGYVKETPILWKPSPYYPDSGSRRFDNLIHTRQNLRWYPFDAFTVGMELKTRLFWGESAQDMQKSIDLFNVNKPYFEWRRDFIEEENALLTSEIDRAWLDWYRGLLQVTLGRQRIAWGTNLVWNPIDLFNPSSPLDFDNEEKPGTDAARAQYYLGPASKIELAIEPHRDGDQNVAAMLMKLNLMDYDCYFLTGRDGETSVLGIAWAGDVKGGGFRGECLWALPDSMSANESPDVTAALSGDYAFTNSLFLHGEVIYSARGTTEPAGGFHLLTALMEGRLTPARLSLFGEIARDLSPLVRADLSGILNPYDHSWYVGPALTWSVATNLDLTGMGLIFGGDSGTEFGDNREILLGRLKWSF